MDKYEFNIKVEQIKKLVNRGDYATAMKICDTIDWRRVRNGSLLSMVSQIYEKNEEYQEAKEVLLIAFERAPVGKRILYKLTDLALREGSVAEAERYYREFCEVAQDDPRQYLLRYLILKAKKAPIARSVLWDYFAYSTALVSRMQLTLIWPGYSSSDSIFLAISLARMIMLSSVTSSGLTMIRTSRPAWMANALSTPG